VLATSPNSGHTATLRSAQMLGFASHFVCPQPLGDILLGGYMQDKFKSVKNLSLT